MFLGGSDDCSGFGALLWYQLGQSSVKATQDSRELAALIQRGFAPPQVDVDRNNAIAETYRLDNELRQANGVIQQWMDHSATLEATLSARDAELAGLRAKNAALQRDLDIAVKAYHDSAAEYAALVKRVLDHTRTDKP
jgi:hypothetical protein